MYVLLSHIKASRLCYLHNVLTTNILFLPRHFRDILRWIYFSNKFSVSKMLFQKNCLRVMKFHKSDSKGMMFISDSWTLCSIKWLKRDNTLHICHLGNHWRPIWRTWVKTLWNLYAIGVAISHQAFSNGVTNHQFLKMSVIN